MDDVYWSKDAMPSPELMSRVFARDSSSAKRKAPNSIARLFPKEVGNIIADRMTRYRDSGYQDSSALFTAEDVGEIKYFADITKTDTNSEKVTPETLVKQTDKSKKAFDGDNPCIS